MGKLIPLTWREYRRAVTRYFAIRVLIGPTVYLFVFAVALSSAFREVEFAGKTMSYFLYMIPGLAASYTYSAFTLTFQLLIYERGSRMLAVLLSSGIDKFEYVLSKILYLLGHVGALASYMVLGGGLISGKMPLSAGNALLFLASTVLGITFWGCAGLCFGILIKGVDVRDIILSVLGVSIAFTSTAYYPLTTAPAPIRVIGTFNPVSAIANTMRFRFLGLPLTPYETRSWIQLVVYTLIALVLATRAVKGMSAR